MHCDSKAAAQKSPEFPICSLTDRLQRRDTTRNSNSLKSLKPTEAQLWTLRKRIFSFKKKDLFCFNSFYFNLWVCKWVCLSFYIPPVHGGACRGQKRCHGPLKVDLYTDSCEPPDASAGSKNRSCVRRKCALLLSLSPDPGPLSFTHPFCSLREIARQPKSKAMDASDSASYYFFRTFLPLFSFSIHPSSFATVSSFHLRIETMFLSEAFTSTPRWGMPCMCSAPTVKRSVWFLSLGDWTLDQCQNLKLLMSFPITDSPKETPLKTSH